MADHGEKEFFVGYLARAPQGLARWLRWRVAALLAAGLLLALLLTASQAPFSSGSFEFGHSRAFEGWVGLDPQPNLLVPGPGGAGLSRYLLVETGKHGSRARMSRFEGSRVHLEGSLVYRDDQTMIELSDAAIRELDGEALAADWPATGVEDLGERTFRGEIVDSKCFLGVMKPGQGKTHRACASRCIAGGIPPVLWVPGGGEGPSFLLLATPEGRALCEEVLEYVAEPVEITGHVLRYGNIHVLASDPRTIHRLP